MSAEPIGAPVPRPARRMSDSELLRALRAGDPHAFATICERHGPALRRFAARILQSRPAVVDDVVQEALLRGHRALRRDDRHIEVRPYLYRLVRNCCLDELARVRTDAVPLHLLHPADEPAGHDAPDATLERRDRLHSTLADLATLPDAQRHALLRREVDGLTHEQVAAELGVSVGASRNLVHRARTALAHSAGARVADCEDIRADLLRAHDARRRPSMAALRHCGVCSACRAFRSAVKRGRRDLRLLAPLPLLLGGGGLLAGKLAAGGSKPLAAKAAAVASASVVAAGGAYALGTHVFGPGARSPFAVHGVALPHGHLAAGARIPAGTALVRRDVRLPAHGAPAPLTLDCPSGMHVAEFVEDPRIRRSHGFDPQTSIGRSTSARVRFANHGSDAGAQVSVAMLCRR